jgi:hypothetical protein
LPGAAMADPKKQQRPRLHLPEMEDLLHGVRVDLARRPSGEPLLRCSVLGLGHANLRVRVSSRCRRPPRDFAVGLVDLDDSVAVVPEQRCSHRFSNLVV